MDKRIFLVGSLSFICNVAFSKNWAPDPALSEEEQAIQNKWFKNVLINSGRTSCCGKGDAYWADELDFGGDGYFFATITDDREIPNRADFNGKKFKVPYDKLDKRYQGNPTGHNVIFVGIDVGSDSSQLEITPVQFVPQIPQKDYYEEGVDGITIYCFFPNAGL